MYRSTLLLIALVACDPSPMIPDGDDGPSPDDGLRTMEIPVQPVTEIRTYSVLSVQSTREGERLDGEAPVSLGFGDGYPTDLTFMGAEMYLGRCAMPPESLSVRSVESDDDGVVRATIIDGELQVQVVGTGEAELVVEGVLEGVSAACAWMSGQDRFDTTVRYQIQVEEPVGSVVQRPWDCSPAEEDDPLVVIDGLATLGGLGAHGLNAASERLYFANAGRYRQVGLTLVLPEGVEASPPRSLEEGLEDVVFSGSGTVQIRGEGSTTSLRIASSAEITDMDMLFILPWGAGRTHLEMEDGETYNVRNMPAGGRVIPHVGLPIVEGLTACSHPDPDWFGFTSDPGVEVQDYSERSAASYPHHIGMSADYQAPGWLTLTLAASEVNQGQGLSKSIRVNLVEE